MIIESVAACGLCVGVGSFSDPPEFQGLAHLLEHMVFMGSEKFPRENEFDAFLNKHGGETNASTDSEATTFYFDCQYQYLFRALERFAQFFISPLIKRNALSRELEALDSEFQSVLQSDSCRRQQLFSQCARPHHPATQFLWGNIQVSWASCSVLLSLISEQFHDFGSVLGEKLKIFSSFTDCWVFSR